MKEVRLNKYPILKICLLIIILICILPSFSSCCKSSVDEGSSNNNVLLSLRVTVLTPKEEDITDLIKDVSVFVFDKDQQYIKTKKIPGKDIFNYTPFEFTNDNVNTYWLVGWGNLEDNELITIPQEGTSLNEVLMQLKRDSEGYSTEPDDLFFGILKLNGADFRNYSDTVNISIKRMTAMVHITVKGLTPSANDNYSLVINGSDKDAYTIDGNLAGKAISYRRNGAFNQTTNNLESATPFLIFPSSSGVFNSISIYNGSQLIATVDKIGDQNSSFAFLAGFTNNIFIDLTNSGTGSANIQIKVTDWKDFYYWLEW